jgi:hypothetical protein
MNTTLGDNAISVSFICTKSSSSTSHSSVHSSNPSKQATADERKHRLVRGHVVQRLRPWIKLDGYRVERKRNTTATEVGTH